MIGKKKQIGILLPLGFDINKSYSLQALMRGTATKEQQIEAVKYIVENLAGVYDETFDVESARKSDYNQGRRSVGRAIVAIQNYNLEKIKKLIKPPEGETYDNT